MAALAWAARAHGNATWADMDPRGHLHGAQAKDNRAKLIGPTGIMDPVEIKGGIRGLVGDTNSEEHPSLLRQNFSPFYFVWD